MLIYNSLVESRLRYGILSWGTATQQQINRLKVLQNKALRYITFSELDTPMLPIYSLLKVLPVDKLLHLSQANFMYGYHHGNLPSNFQAYFSKPTHSYPTRFSKSNFSLPALQENMSEKSMKVLGPKVWTNITQEMKSLPFRKTFSRHLKLSLLDSLPKYTGQYKQKFDRKNEIPTSLQEIFWC